MTRGDKEEKMKRGEGGKGKLNLETEWRWRERQCLEGKVPIDARTNVFNAHSVYRACSRPDDIQTFGHDRMKTFHQLPVMLVYERLQSKGSTLQTACEQAVSGHFNVCFWGLKIQRLVEFSCVWVCVCLTEGCWKRVTFVWLCVYNMWHWNSKAACFKAMWQHVNLPCMNVTQQKFTLLSAQTNECETKRNHHISSYYVAECCIVEFL